MREDLKKRRTGGVAASQILGPGTQILDFGFQSVAPQLRDPGSSFPEAAPCKIIVVLQWKIASDLCRRWSPARARRRLRSRCSVWHLRPEPWTLFGSCTCPRSEPAPSVRFGAGPRGGCGGASSMPSSVSWRHFFRRPFSMGPIVFYIMRSFYTR